MKKHLSLRNLLQSGTTQSALGIFFSEYLCAILNKILTFISILQILWNKKGSLNIFVLVLRISDMMLASKAEIHILWLPDSEVLGD